LRGNDRSTVLFMARVARDRLSQMDGSQRFGSNEAQAGDEIRNPGLRYVLEFPRGLGWAVFGSLGRLRLSFFSLRIFFFSETVISLVN
jgi:hypothetical protein